MPTTGDSARCSRRRRNFSRLRSRWTLASRARWGKELLGLVQLRGEGEDDVDGDGGLPDCCCFLLCFCFSVSSRVLPFLSRCLCYYWKTKTMADGDGGLNPRAGGYSPAFFFCCSSLSPLSLFLCSRSLCFPAFFLFLVCPFSPVFLPPVRGFFL